MRKTKITINNDEMVVEWFSDEDDILLPEGTRVRSIYIKDVEPFEFWLKYNHLEIEKAVLKEIDNESRHL